MGLSEEDKKKMPYFREKALEEEKKRWEKFTESPEFVKVSKTFERGYENYMYHVIMADFHAKKIEKITVEQVASATIFWMPKIFDILTKARFYQIEKMLEKFDLVKKEKK